MSHISCLAETVLTQATNAIQAIRTERITRDEENIARAMLKKHFWTRKPFTRKDAIKYLNESDMWGWRSAYGWGTMQVLQKLVLLAKHGNPVFVDEIGAKALWG